MSKKILAIAALAASLPACVRPLAQPTAGARPGDLRGAASEGGERGMGRVGLVPLSTTGEHPVRGGVYWDESGGAKRLVSTSCADDESLWFCARDHWLVGENRREAIEHPAKRDDALLVAADLGVSVRFGPDQRTIIYLGDSAGRPLKAGCGSVHPKLDCNDAILVVDPADTDPADGLSTRVVAWLTPDGGVRGFVPQIIPGVNGRKALKPCAGEIGRRGGPACLGAFNVPTGAASVRMKASLLRGVEGDAEGKVDAVFMVYAAAIARGEATSWMVASADGYRFERLARGPFSKGKFIQVAPVPLLEKERRSLCAAEPASPLCNASLGMEGDVLLLFGDGETYRESRLFLAVLSLEDLSVRYYSAGAGGAERWASDEASATPIISGEGADGFGELSVVRVDADACPADARARCEDSLVMLSNRNGIVRYRTASLAFPGARGRMSGSGGWSAERRTSAQGYGPYVLDAFTRVERAASGALQLVLYHTVSAWNGRGAKDVDRAPYGVFTRRLMLIDDASCHKGPRGEPRCQEIPPPWPPAP